MIFRIALTLYECIVLLIKAIHPYLRESNSLHQYFSLRKNLPIDVPIVDKPIVFHCSSYGEFEVIKPVIRKIKAYSPDQKIILSIFSPSSFDLLNERDLFDYKIYSPLETRTDCGQWFRTYQPTLIVISQNEIWPLFLDCAQKAQIPVVYVGSTFRKSSVKLLFFYFARPLLTKVNHFFLQSEEAFQLFTQLELTNFSKIERLRDVEIRHITSQQVEIPTLAEFARKKPLFVLASTHSSELKILGNSVSKLKEKYHFLIAPHDITQHSIKDIRETFEQLNIILFSEGLDKEEMVILDQFGLLKHVYKYADMVYVGGGFDKGVHNVMEAAIHKRPILIGPKYQKFEEVKELIDLQVVFPCRSSEEFDSKVELVEALQPEDIQGRYRQFSDQLTNPAQFIVQFLIKNGMI